MGYDVERFVGYVNEGLLCCICRDVLEDPLQAPCEHAFCSTCIDAWLVHHHNCPEDRLPLDIANLRPLHRYMRNDLARLQVRCEYRSQGCEVISALESVHRHEQRCDFALVDRRNTGCPVQASHRPPEAHLCGCERRSRPCAGGCALRLPTADEAQHNRVSELRAELDFLRVEAERQVEEVRREMESRLESQRRHMVQKETLLKNEVDELKAQLSCVMADVCVLLGAERARRQELGRSELLELLQKEGLRLTTPSQPATLPTDGHHKPSPPSVTLDYLKRKSKDVPVTNGHTSANLRLSQLSGAY